MKHTLSRPSILATVGILQLKYQHVSAAYVKLMGTEMFQTGLEARILPPLTFTEERKVLIPSDKDKEYTVSLIVKAHNSIRTKGRWQAKRKFTFSSAIIDSFLKRSRGYTRLKEEGNPSERNPSQSSSSVQLPIKNGPMFSMV